MNDSVTVCDLQYIAGFCGSLLQLEWRGSGSHLVALNAIPSGEILIQRRHRCRVERVRLSLLCCVMCRKLERSRVCE